MVMQDGANGLLAARSFTLGGGRRGRRLLVLALSPLQAMDGYVWTGLTGWDAWQTLPLSSGARLEWQVYECPDCKGWGCKPPSDTCPTCNGEGLVKRRIKDNDT